jgi:ribonuclease HI
LQAALDELGVGTEWDAAIVGDGSGTGWDRCCGWAATLVDHYTGFQMPSFGGWSHGTSYLAELQPYLGALSWYASGPGRAYVGARRDDGSFGRVCRVHVLCDNSAAVNCGNRACDRSTYGWFWRAFDEFEERGYVLEWHHVPRQKLGLNRLADQVAGIVRVRMEQLTADLETILGQPLGNLAADLAGPTT